MQSWLYSSCRSMQINQKSRDKKATKSKPVLNYSPKIINQVTLNDLLEVKMKITLIPWSIIPWITNCQEPWLQCIIIVSVSKSYHTMACLLFAGLLSLAASLMFKAFSPDTSASPAYLVWELSAAILALAQTWPLWAAHLAPAPGLLFPVIIGPRSN